jgi:hypothetical protein
MVKTWRYLDPKAIGEDLGVRSVLEDSLQCYLATPSTGPRRTIAAWKALQMSQGVDPRFAQMNERAYDGPCKEGMPEE